MGASAGGPLTVQAERVPLVTSVTEFNGERHRPGVARWSDSSARWDTEWAEGSARRYEYF